VTAMRSRVPLTLAVLAWSRLALGQTPAPPASRTAVVVFRADHADAVLESDWAPNAAASPWYALCVAPCEQKVVADARLRVAGPGLYASRIFKLPLERDRVAVTATMESRSVAGGVVLLAIGYALLGVTSPALVVGGLAREHGGTPLILSGIGVGVAGAVAGGFGLMLMVRRSQYKESRVRMSRASVPRLELPAGLALEPRGLTF
jgi:hypothetical protein